MAMFARWALVVAGLGVVALATAAEPQGMDDKEPMPGHEGMQGMHGEGMRGEPGMERAQMGDVQQQIRGWPEASRKAATSMIEKYGQPDMVTDMLLVWDDNGPWKRTIVYREPVEHRFPVPHMDVLEQVIDYEVPAEYHDDIALYDGSVHIYRTEGEISAKCDQEAANFLALNLADDIVKGEKTVAEARLAYGDNILAMKQGQEREETRGLTFQVSEGQTAFSDEPIIENERLVGVGLDQQKLQPVDLEKDVNLDQVQQELRRVQQERELRPEGQRDPQRRDPQRRDRPQRERDQQRDDGRSY